MAYLINEQCTACGQCVQICPNQAISEGCGTHRINPYFCTECLGFADAPQCASICPVDAIESSP